MGEVGGGGVIIAVVVSRWCLPPAMRRLTRACGGMFCRFGNATDYDDDDNDHGGHNDDHCGDGGDEQVVCSESHYSTLFAAAASNKPLTKQLEGTFDLLYFDGCVRCLEWMHRCMQQIAVVVVIVVE